MGSCGSLVLLSLLQCVAHFLVIRVPYWVGSSCSFSFTLPPLEHGLCYAFLFPQALPSCPHDFPPLSLQVTGSVVLGQHIEVIVQPASRVASSATESTWGSLTAWSWISSLIAPLGQQHPRHWEPIPANCQCSLKLDFYFFYLTVPTPIKPSFVAWKMRKKEAKCLWDWDSAVPIWGYANQNIQHNLVKQETINIYTQLKWGRDKPQNNTRGRE